MVYSKYFMARIKAPGVICPREGHYNKKSTLKQLYRGLGRDYKHGRRRVNKEGRRIY